MNARSLFFASCLGVSLGITATAHAQGGFGPPELTLVPVKDNIYMIRNMGAGNITMLVGQKYVILIDWGDSRYRWASTG